MLRHSEEELWEELLPEGLICWPKLLPQSLGSALHKGQFLLKGILQARINGPRVLLHHPHHHPYPYRPVLHLLAHPLLLCYGVPNITPQISDTLDNGESSPPEKALLPRKVMRVENQDSLGRIQEISHGGPPHYDVV